MFVETTVGGMTVERDQRKDHLVVAGNELPPRHVFDCRHTQSVSPGARHTLPVNRFAQGRPQNIWA